MEVGKAIFIGLHLGVSVNAEPNENSLHQLTERNLCFHNSLLNSYTRHRQVHQVQGCIRKVKTL